MLINDIHLFHTTDVNLTYISNPLSVIFVENHDLPKVMEPQNRLLSQLLSPTVRIFTWCQIAPSPTLPTQRLCESVNFQSLAQVDLLLAQNTLFQSPLLRAALSTLSTLKLVLFELRTDSVNRLC